MKASSIFLKIVFIILLVVFSARNSSLAQQYQAYETLLGRGDSKYNSGVSNFNSKKYQAALTDFNDAIRYYESSKKVNPQPANAAAELEKKIAAAREKIRSVRKATTPVPAEAPPVEVVPSLSISRDTVRFTFRKDEQSVIVTSNVEWYIEPFAEDNWCEITKGNEYVTIVCDENKVPFARQVSFEVIAGDSGRVVVVEQSGPEPFLSVKPEEEERRFMPYHEGVQYIVPMTNVQDWSLETKETSWFTVSKDSVNGRISISCAEYQEEVDRIDTFKIKADKIEIPITVYQTGLKFYVDPRELPFPLSGGSQTLRITSTYITGWAEGNLPDWCKVDNRTKNSLIISCSENTGAKREAELEIKSGGKIQTIKISQAEAEATTSISETVYSFGYDASSKKIILPGASDWKITRLPEWCQLTEKKEVDFTIRCLKNTLAIPRMDTIEITAPYKTIKVKITQDSKKIPASRYESIGRFSEELAIVRTNGKYGYITRNGKEVIPVVYDSANDFQNGMTIVELNKKFGYIDKKGNHITPLKYDSVGVFHEGYAVVEIEGKYGYINLKGKEITSIQYDSAKDFEGGVGFVMSAGKELGVDRKGQVYDPKKVLIERIGVRK
ncbi:MAG: WG repeat-containing protein [Tannerellaceae bacterium]|nr:WG repeat-containing protein [Tannerellaceae bacterium]